MPSEQVARLVAAGKLNATTDFSALKEVDAVSICVPTPLRKTGDPDLSFIVNATDDLAHYVHPGMVVVLESTTYPGTTREIMLPKLSETAGLESGGGFLPGLLARAGGSRAQRLDHDQHAQGDRRHHPGLQ